MQLPVDCKMLEVLASEVVVGLKAKVYFACNTVPGIVDQAIEDAVVSR